MNNKQRFQLSFILFILLLSSCGYLVNPKVTKGITHLQKGTYSIDQQHTSVLFKVEHMGLSTYVGRFNTFDAALEFDPNNMANAKLSAVIDLASVDLNNQNLEDMLRGPSFFNTTTFPQASFHTTSVRVIDDSHATFTGNLQLHGISAPIDMNVTFNGAANNILTGYYTLGFTATTQFKRSVFGIDYLVPAVSDAVTIDVFAEFQKNK